MAAKTIEVVAVLDSTIEIIMVALITPMMMFLGFVPAILSVNLKRVSSSFVLAIAFARKKPPSKSQMILSENVLT